MGKRRDLYKFCYVLVGNIAILTDCVEWREIANKH